MMKSTDMEAKYNAAVKYYEKKDYYHALQLFEELITVYRGTSTAEQSYFYYVYCTYYVDGELQASTTIHILLLMVLLVLLHTSSYMR